MSQRFFRCRFCGLPHEWTTTVCPISGIPVPQARSLLPGAPTSPCPPAFPSSVPPLPDAPPALRVPRPPPLPDVARLERSGARSPSASLQPTLAEPAQPGAPQRFESTASRLETGLSSSSLVGTLVGGRYRIKRVLAEGGMGVVYEGVHVELGRRVAIKTLSARHAEDAVAITRFRNEARAAGSLGHPNIVEVYDMGTLPEGAPYLVMEHLDGETLGQHLKRERVMPVDFAIEVTAQVLSALAAAHARGIIHRDLKPENVFLSRRMGLAPVAKLLDFGISKVVRPDDDGSTLTRTGFVMGTPAYMAPEQARGDRDLDGRVDLYAAGVVAFEMLTGRLPYASKNPAALLVEFQRAVPPTPRLLRPEVPAWFDAVVTKLMAHDRCARFASAGDALGVIVARGRASPALSAEDPTAVSALPMEVRGADTSQRVQIFSRPKGSLR